MTPPYIIDDGEPGTWLDMLANSPCLKVSNYQIGESAEGDRKTHSIPAASPHSGRREHPAQATLHSGTSAGCSPVFNLPHVSEIPRGH